MEENTNATVLSEYDFIVAIDKSGSMGEEDMPGNKSRWEAVQESAIAFCRDIQKIDTDGLGLVLFGGASIVVTGRKSHNVLAHLKHGKQNYD